MGPTYRIDKLGGIRSGNVVMRALPPKTTRRKALDALREWRESHHGGASYVLTIVREVAA